MAGLTAPTPVVEPLVARNPASPEFLVEVPLAVRSAPAALPDGTSVGPERLAVSGCLLLRRTAAFAAADVWDVSQSTWMTELSPQGQAAQPLPMSFHAGQPRPWLGVFANVPTAGGGAMLEAQGLSGFPVYFARTVFATRVGGRSGRSADSPPVGLEKAAKRIRPELELIPEDPMTATSLTLRLRTAGGAEVGSLRILDGPPGTVELRNSGGARVTLTAAGDIDLVPRAGRRVLVDGRLVGHSPATGDHNLFVP